CIKGDIRDQALLKHSLPGSDIVIHLACISNDPSFELDPGLSRSINYEAFEPLVAIARECAAKRFIYASTSSVYGVSDEENVTEDHPLVPLTVNNRRITIFGGAQKRPNLHIEDMTDLYVDLLSMPAAAFAGKTFNAGYQNHTVADLGRMVHSVVLRELPHLAPIAQDDRVDH